MRAAWRLQAHFHELHYLPVADPRDAQRPAVGDRPLTWWAVKRVAGFSGRSNLWLAGGFGGLYAAYLVAGDAWQRCRAGQLDPNAFGILDMYGLWFIASNVIRDAAALNDHVMLPWDVWGAMTPRNDELDPAFTDRLAALTVEPDRHFGDRG